MSADNGIYIGWFGDKEYRVIHAQAIGNVFYPDGENALEIERYFGPAHVFHSSEDAQRQAFKMEDEIMSDKYCPILEYGINTIKFSKSFSEYVKEAEQQREFNRAMGGDVEEIS